MLFHSFSPENGFLVSIKCKSFFPDLFLHILITLSFLCIELSNSQVFSPVGLNPLQFQSNLLPPQSNPFPPSSPLHAGSLASHLFWSSSQGRQALYQSYYQSLPPQLNQLPFFRTSYPLSQQYQTAGVMPYPIVGSATLPQFSGTSSFTSSRTGLTPQPVQVDGSLGSRIHPLKDVTGIWNKLGLTSLGTNLGLSSSNLELIGSSSKNSRTNLELGSSSSETRTNFFIPGSSSLSSQSQVGQRVLTPTVTTLTRRTLNNPSLLNSTQSSPLGHPLLSQILPYDFQNRHQEVFLDPMINKRLKLGLLPGIDHRSSVQQNSLDSRLKFQQLQNQILSSQMSGHQVIQSGQSCVLIRLHSLFQFSSSSILSLSFHSLVLSLSLSLSLENVCIQSTCLSRESSIMK